MNCVILQPSYIPWRGYFDQIRKADVFVFYDDVQYDKHGWRNRNRIKTSHGTTWLTIPVQSGGSVSQGRMIKDMRIDPGQSWGKKHWESIRQSYAKAPHFARYEALFASFYERKPELLADFTIETTMALARELGIASTRFVRSSELPTEGVKTERLIGLLTHLGATHYISGPSARDYLDEAALARAGISLEYMVYDYPEYPQLYPPFEPQVSVLDLMVMTGPEASRYIWDRGP